ncbi:hypothetical protein ACOSP7_027329 [Xanthoceras sorbifolium]|uniref:Alpha/beta hydrolase fold-3 domain-containing protein n=1 Tax=Xanthoceras sorbifolium TaxID=99658 RepID=A0ABQ8HFZ4_9ROSI|nr:hypothetical protein JRO89_XS11G0173900 [Xanthoceras sorbifolium]
MSDEIAQTQPTVDPYKYLQIVTNPDGSITRNENMFPKTPAANPDPPHQNIPVLSKDVFINQSNNVWVRLYITSQPLDNKLPLIVYYHGGGFILCGADTNIFHDFCSNMAVQLQAVVVSVEYPLAPEHRLPAAYDDAMEVFHWIKTNQEVWLQRHVDFSDCFLMGTSAGGNIAYHVGLRAAAEVDHLMPLKIEGLILHHSFFGGVKRTGSELRLANDPILPICVTDVMWELSLPLGADRDHEYCNPTVDNGSKLLEQIRSLGWKVMVIGCDGNPLIDRQIHLAKIME